MNFASGFAIALAVETAGEMVVTIVADIEGMGDFGPDSKEAGAGMPAQTGPAFGASEEHIGFPLANADLAVAVDSEVADVEIGSAGSMHQVVGAER